MIHLSPQTVIARLQNILATSKPNKKVESLTDRKLASFF